MIPNLQKILKEWSYRVGVIKPKDKKHLHQLNNILQEDICNQIKQEYNKCMIYTGDCKELNDALQNLCKIYQ